MAGDPTPQVPSRKIVQITAGNIGGTYWKLFALCDDGSVWEYYEDGRTKVWELLWDPAAGPMNEQVPSTRVFSNG